MAVYKVKKFRKFASDNGIPDKDLKAAADEVADGNFDADLGGGVYKKRIARAGGGKSGGFRTFITHKTSEHLFFVYGFPKSARDNIDEKEDKALKAYAKTLGKMNAEQIRLAIDSGELVEIVENENQGGEQNGEEDEG